MFKFISGLPIFRRLFIAFALAAIVPGIIIVALSSYYLNSLTIRDQAVKTSFEAQNLASQEMANLEGMNALLQTSHNEIFAHLSGVVQDSSLPASGALIYNDIVAREAEFQQSLGTFQNNYQLGVSSNMSTITNVLLSDNANTDLISQQQGVLNVAINQQWPRYKQWQDKTLTILRTLQNQQLTAAQTRVAYETAYNNLFQANYSFTDLRNSWQRVVDIAITIGETVTNVGPSQTQPVIIATAIAFIFTVLIVITTGYVVNRTITRPLGELAALTRRITKGDTSARAKVLSRDEIAMVGNSMNNMLDNIVHLIQDAQNQRDILQGQVEKLVSEVSGVGEGDLRIQAEVTADALGVLADSFNYMVEELGSLVVRVKMVAREVEGSTTMTFERMSQLVDEADAQLQQIANAGVEIERMADASRQVADRSQNLFSSAREARLIAQTGREAVQQTVEGMDRIHTNVQDTSQKVQNLGERSREINNIVEVISNIAHQTNRLALDAAIQAAMAGENGKGFGAVAADIRRLAERAKEQASSITRIVRSVRDEIGSVAVSMRDTERETSAGSRLAEEAGTSLESIFAVVEHQAQEIETINAMAMQQQQSSNAVVRIMQTVSDSTEQSSTSTREAAQNMERLARLAEQLLSSVEAFKLRESLNYLTPNANTTVTPEDEENQFSVSGVFRTVTSTAHPLTSGSGVFNELATAGTGYGSPSSNEYSPYSLAPYTQQGNGQGYPSQPLYPQQGNGQGYPSQPLYQGNDQGYPSQPRYTQQGNGQGYPSQPLYPQQDNGQGYPPQQGNGNGSNGHGQGHGRGAPNGNGTAWPQWPPQSDWQ